MRPGKYLLLLLPALTLLAWFVWSQLDVVKPTVKIGVLHSLTGTMAQSESPLVDAVRLAVEEANQSGGIRGARIEMVVTDCRSDADYCAQQAEKLITQDKVKALFGCWTSACRKAVKPVVEKHQHLLFYPVQYEGLEQSPDIIYTGAAPNQQLIPMVAWALQNKGRRVYLIGSDYVFPRTANKIVKKLLRAYDVSGATQASSVVAETYVSMGEKNLEDAVHDIARLHPDFVVNTLNGSSNEYFFRALKQAGIQAKDIPVFSTSLAEAELQAIGPELLTGHYAAWNYFQSIDSDENRRFISRFRQRFGTHRVLDDPMEAAYIGVNLWVNTVRSSQSTDVQTVKRHLELESFAAPEGVVVLDAQTRHLWKTPRIGQARKDGQFDLVWQSARSIAPAPFPFFIPLAELSAMGDSEK